MISIKAQSPPLQTIVKAAIRTVTGDALFSTAYPSAVTVADYFRNTLRTTAEDLKFSTLSQAFEEDRMFVETISRLVCYPVLILLPCLIFDHSWLSDFQASVAA